MSKRLPASVTEARARLSTRAIFFAHILFERCELIVSDVPNFRGADCATACTDGRDIFIHAPFFDSLPTAAERAFVIAHEVWHVMSMHPKRTQRYAIEGLCGYPLVMDLWQLCMDAVINVGVDKCGFGKAPDGIFFMDPKYLGGYQIQGNELPEKIYEMFLDNMDKDQLEQMMKQAQRAKAGDGGDGSGGEDGEGDGQGQGSGLPSNANDPLRGDVQKPQSEQAKAVSENEMRASVASAANTAKAVGNLPGHLRGMIDEFLDPQVSWQNELRHEIVCRSGNDRYNWSRPNRRKLVSPGVYMPRRTGLRAGHIVAGLDTSGSVSDHEMKMFLGELAAILNDVRPDSLTLLWCDARVDRVDVLEEVSELERITRAERLPGGGGTSFIPPFEYVQDNHLDCDIFIYLTDGYGPFPDEALVPFPSIWVISNDDVKSPIGKTIPITIR